MNMTSGYWLYKLRWSKMCLTFALEIHGTARDVVKVTRIFGGKKTNFICLPTAHVMLVIEWFLMDTFM